MPPPEALKLTGQMKEHAPGVEDAWASGWNAVTARMAVDSHKRGHFVHSWQLSIDAPSYPPIRAALRQVVSAARSATYEVTGPERAPGRLEVEAARDLMKLIADLEKSTHRDIAMMGFSVWQHPVEVNEETLRHEVTSIERWPLAAVEYMPWTGARPEGYYAITKDGVRILLPKAGTTDGHWTVVGEGDMPHLDGAILALDMSFVAGQSARRAFSNMTGTTGKASVLAELPEGVSTDSPEGRAMLAMVKALGTTQAAGVHPKGGKVYPFELTSEKGTLVQDMTAQEAQMVSWALLGHAAVIEQPDGQYTNPAAQAVPEDLTRENVKTFCRAVNAIFAMLSLVNAGRDVEPPVLTGTLPDSDQDARLKAEAERAKGRGERHALLMDAIEAERRLGPVTQKRVDELAAAFDVPAPKLGDLDATPPPSPLDTPPLAEAT